MTEDEAKEKWCPMARALDHSTPVSVNRVAEAAGEPDPDCYCIASACMMWRWEIGARLSSGYCGLAGKVA